MIKDLGFLKKWGPDRVNEEIAKAPAVILAKLEHKCFTEKLREVEQPSLSNMGKMLDGYRKAYSHEPNWSKAVEQYLKSLN